MTDFDRMKRKLESSDLVDKSETGCLDIAGVCNQLCETGNLQSGLLTSRLRPCTVPRARLTRYYQMRLENYSNVAKFDGIPEWLKPFLHAHQQLGWAEEWLCSIFENLPFDLLSCIHVASVAVVVLSLYRQERSKESVFNQLFRSSEELFPIEDEPWLYQGIGLSDDELETFHQADFGIMR